MDKTTGRNHEVTDEQELLNEHGELREPGWSRKLVQKYDIHQAPTLIVPNGSSSEKIRFRTHRGRQG